MGRSFCRAVVAVVLLTSAGCSGDVTDPAASSTAAVGSGGASTSTASTTASGMGGTGGAATGTGGIGQGGAGTGGVGGTGGAMIAEVVPDFTILDVNPSSGTFDQPVSPRDYLMRVSAWYFGHAT